MHDKRELDKRLAKAGMSPLKKLGQNFLLNEKICKAITDTVREQNPKSVVEIGPGLGALTDDLAGQEWNLILIELDGGAVEYWRNQNLNIEIIPMDALKLDWASQKWEKPSVLVSNLPYSLAASLVVELSSRVQPFQILILMFQKEVAERIEAKPNSSDYGMLSVVAQSQWEITRVIDAGPQDFYPVPHVGSRVLRFISKEESSSKSEFLKLVKLAFSQRRKKLSSNLSAHYPKPKIAEAFEKMGLKDDIRAQELAPKDFLRLLELLML